MKNSGHFKHTGIHSTSHRNFFLFSTNVNGKIQQSTYFFEMFCKELHVFQREKLTLNKN